MFVGEKSTPNKKIRVLELEKMQSYLTMNREQLLDEMKQLRVR